MTGLRVVIAEDSAILRDGLVQLLTDRDHDVVAMVGDAVELRRKFPDMGVLVFSQWVETRYAAELLAGNAAGVGYLLKDRVADVGEFVDALTRVAAGGTVLDPEVVSQLLGSTQRRAVLDQLTPREREVLDLMAQGLSNSAIAKTLVVSDRAVEKHVGNIFTKLDLPPSDAHHRRVLAVLKSLA